MKGSDGKEDARGAEGEKEIRQKKRGDARWMGFHRGRRDAVCALLKKVSGAAERKHTRRTRVATLVGSDAGRAVATPGVR